MRPRFCFLALALTLAFSPALALAQEATLSGRVTTEDGTPMANVSVFIPELGVGSFTRRTAGIPSRFPAHASLVKQLPSLRVVWDFARNPFGYLSEPARLRRILVSRRIRCSWARSW